MRHVHLRSFWKQECVRGCSRLYRSLPAQFRCLLQRGPAGLNCVWSRGVAYCFYNFFPPFKPFFLQEITSAYPNRTVLRDLLLVELSLAFICSFYHVRACVEIIFFRFFLFFSQPYGTNAPLVRTRTYDVHRMWHLPHSIQSVFNSFNVDMI